MLSIFSGSLGPAGRLAGLERSKLAFDLVFNFGTIQIENEIENTGHEANSFHVVYFGEPLGWLDGWLALSGRSLHLISFSSWIH